MRIPLRSVELFDGRRAEITMEPPGDWPGFRGEASVDDCSDERFRLQLDAHCDLRNAKHREVCLALLRAGLRALEIMLEPPGEVVDAGAAELGPPKMRWSATRESDGRWRLYWCATDGRAISGERVEACPDSVAAEFRALDCAWRAAFESVARELLQRAPGAVADLERLATARADKLIAIAEALFGEPAADTNVDDIPVERFVEATRKLAASRGALERVALAHGAVFSGHPHPEQLEEFIADKMAERADELRAARAGREDAWAALDDLAKRLGVTLDGGESCAAIADALFAASARGQEQRDIDDLLGRIAEIRRALGLDEDCYHGAVMERLEAVYEIAEAVRTELGFADFDGLGDSVVSVLSRFPTVCKQYDELAAAIGCGANPDHGTAVRKAEHLQREHDAAVAERRAIAEAAGESGACLASHVRALRAELDATSARLGDMRKVIGLPPDASPTETAQRLVDLAGLERREAAAFSALQRLRMALFLSTTPAVTPAEIVDAALARIERAAAPRDLLSKMRAATEKLEAAAVVDVDRLRALLDKALRFIETHDGWPLSPGQDFHGWLVQARELVPGSAARPTAEPPRVLGLYAAASSIKVNTLRGLHEHNGQPVAAHNPLPVAVGGVRTSIVGLVADADADGPGQIIVTHPVAARSGAPVLVLAE